MIARGCEERERQTEIVKRERERERKITKRNITIRKNGGKRDKDGRRE